MSQWATPTRLPRCCWRSPSTLRRQITVPAEDARCAELERWRAASESTNREGVKNFKKADELAPSRL